MKKLIFIIVMVLSMGLFNSCSKDALEPTLADQTYTNLRTLKDLTMLLDGSYNAMGDYRYYGRNMIIANEVRGDNVFANGNSGRFIAMGQMNLTQDVADVADMMNTIYGATANANIIINADLSNIKSDVADVLADPVDVNHAKGQAYAIRAMVHFDLLRLFGQQHVTGQGGMDAKGVSYIKNFKEPLLVARSTVAETKQMIYADLDMALSLMSASKNDALRIRLTTFGVQALKARVAIYFKDYAIAKTACEAVIGSGSFSVIPVTSFVSSWSAQAYQPNSIFELAKTATSNSGINGLSYIYRGTSYGDIQVLNQFITNAEFSATDIRRSSSMIGLEGTKLRNLGKYPSTDYTDDIKVFRYEEVVLNYAEAIMDTDPTLALIFLNSVPLARNGSTYSVANIDNILKERRKEFAFEGFRFDDLARNGRNIPVLDPVAQTHGGPTYGSFKYAMPIPRREIDTNPLTSQNFGY